MRHQKPIDGSKYKDILTKELISDLIDTLRTELKPTPKLPPQGNDLRAVAISGSINPLTPVSVFDGVLYKGTQSRPCVTVGTLSRAPWGVLLAKATTTQTAEIVMTGITWVKATVSSPSHGYVAIEGSLLVSVDSDIKAVARIIASVDDLALIEFLSIRESDVNFKGIVLEDTPAGTVGAVSTRKRGVDKVLALNHSNCDARTGDAAFIGVESGEYFYTLCKCCDPDPTVDACCSTVIYFCICNQVSTIAVNGGSAVFDVSSCCTSCTSAALVIVLSCDTGTGEITGTWTLNCDGNVTTGSILEDLDLLCDTDPVTLSGTITSSDCTISYLSGNNEVACEEENCVGTSCLQAVGCVFQDLLGTAVTSCTSVGKVRIATYVQNGFTSVLSSDSYDVCEGIPHTLTYTVTNGSGVVKNLNGFGEQVTLYTYDFNRFDPIGTVIGYTPANATFVAPNLVRWTDLSYAIGETKTFTITFMPGPQCTRPNTSTRGRGQFTLDGISNRGSEIVYLCADCVDCTCGCDDAARVFDSYPTEIDAIAGFSLTIEALTPEFSTGGTWEVKAIVQNTSLSTNTLDELNITSSTLGSATTVPGGAIVSGDAVWTTEAFTGGETREFTAVFTNTSTACPGGGAETIEVNIIDGGSSGQATASYICTTC